MGAELGAFGGIEGALEEGAEDGGVDIAPVLPDGLLQVEQGGAAQLDGVGMVEEIAIEVGDFAGAKVATIGHFGEEVVDHLVEGIGILVMSIDDIGERIRREQIVSVFGIEAEDDLVEVAGKALGIFVAVIQLHGSDYFANVLCCLFRQLFDRTLRLEFFGMEENIAQLGQWFGFIQIFNGDLVKVGFFTGEVGLDAD